LYFPNIWCLVSIVIQQLASNLHFFFRISMGGLYGSTMPLRGQVDFGVAVVAMAVVAMAVVVVMVVAEAGMVVVIMAVAVAVDMVTMATGVEVAMEVVVIMVLQVELEGTLLLEAVTILPAATSALTVVLVEILLLASVLLMVQLAVMSFLPVPLVTTLAAARKTASWAISSRKMSPTAMPTRRARESLATSYVCQLNLLKSE
jgi:hypothetical protein